MSGVASYSHHLLSGHEPDKSGHDPSALPREYALAPLLQSHFTQYQVVDLYCTELQVNPDIIRTYSDIGSRSLARVHSSDNKRRWTTYRLPDTGGLHKPDKGTWQQPTQKPVALGVDRTEASGVMPDKGVDMPDKEGVMPDSPKRRTRVSPELTKARILELCQGRYLTPKELAAHLGKDDRYISNIFIYPLVKEGRLRPKFSSSKRKDQAYTTALP